MFVPFSTTKEDIDKLRSRHPNYSLLNEANTRGQVKNDLGNLINGVNGVIDGSVLQQFWFPTQDHHYDVFISHSHSQEDYTKAIQLASWLDKCCGLNCFVDGFVWKSADDLLKDIDKKYTWHPDRGVYDYNERNFSTSHVHAMLTMAIYDIIDRSECCIFIKSDSSIRLQGIKEQTLSPWLYEELTFMKKARIQIPSRYQHLKREIRYFSKGVSMEMLDESRKLEVSYNVNLKDFNTLSSYDFESLYGKGTEGLDALYKEKNVLNYIISKF